MIIVSIRSGDHIDDTHLIVAHNEVVLVDCEIARKEIEMLIMWCKKEADAIRFSQGGWVHYGFYSSPAEGDVFSRQYGLCGTAKVGT